MCIRDRINTGTSTKGPITAAKASPEFIPNTAIATAMANSKLLLDAVKDKVCLLYTSPSPRDRTRSRMPSSA